MTSFLRGIKQIPWWLWLIILFGLAALVGQTSETANDISTQEPPKTVPKESAAGSITNAELVEFDNKVLELDPDEKLITGVTQANDLVVDVAITAGFSVMPDVQQGEVAIAMRDALTKICECSPYLKFETEGGQRIVEIGNSQPKFK